MEFHRPLRPCSSINRHIVVLRIGYQPCAVAPGGSASASTYLEPPKSNTSTFASAITTSTAISCSRHSTSDCRRHRRSPKPKPKPIIAFPPSPLCRLVSSALRRLLPRLCPLGGGCFKRRGRRTAQAEEIAALVLSLALVDWLAVLADSWHASDLGQVLGICVPVWGRGRSKRNELRRLVAFLLGLAFCALVSHFRGVAFLEGLGKTGSGRKLAQILLH